MANLANIKNINKRNMKLIFDNNAQKNKEVEKIVEEFLKRINTLENNLEIPIVIFQDGVNRSYYIKCCIDAEKAAKYCDTDAKLDYNIEESFRANRELMLKNKTYLKMEEDAKNGREFNDIIVEYNKNYIPEKPLKIWGGQHRLSAIAQGGNESHRYHGFKIYFDLSKQQRTEVALISNTNISVSNDTFDRMIEETTFGSSLREWCQSIGFLKMNEDFPDKGSTSEKITVKKARSFIVNFYLGLETGERIELNELDKNVYEPYLVETGVVIDEMYKNYIAKNKILNDERLRIAGKKFLKLHNAQYKAILNAKNKELNKKQYKNKVYIESIISSWSFIAGLLQNDQRRLRNHYSLPKTSTKILDPLNAREMSNFKHDSDPPTYRGLGTRTSMKDRQRVAQLFLAKSLSDEATLIDKNFMNRAVSQVVGLITLAQGYIKS